MAGQSWQQDLEVTGHIAFTGSRERERCLGAARLPFPFSIQPGRPACRIVSSIFRMGLPTSVNVIWELLHKLVQSCVSMVI